MTPIKFELVNQASAQWWQSWLPLGVAILALVGVGWQIRAADKRAREDRRHTADEAEKNRLDARKRAEANMTQLREQAVADREEARLRDQRNWRRDELLQASSAALAVSTEVRQGLFPTAGWYNESDQVWEMRVQLLGRTEVLRQVGRQLEVLSDNDQLPALCAKLSIALDTLINAVADSRLAQLGETTEEHSDSPKAVEEAVEAVTTAERALAAGIKQEINGNLSSAE